MYRIEHDIKTGKTKTVELSAEEESDAIAKKMAREESENIELPTLQEQIDALFIGGKTAEDMKAKIDAIKEKTKP